MLRTDEKPNYKKFEQICIMCGQPQECAGCKRIFVHRLTPGSAYCANCALVPGATAEWRKQVLLHDDYMQLPRPDET